jgi:hypothetical protein
MKKTSILGIVRKIMFLRSKIVNPRDSSDTSDEPAIRRTVSRVKIQERVQNARGSVQSEPKDSGLVLSRMDLMFGAKCLGKTHVCAVCSATSLRRSASQCRFAQNE